MTSEDLRQELGPLIRELGQFREEVRARHATKADLYQMENRLLKWVFGLLVGVMVSGLAAVASLGLTLFRVLN